MNLQYVAHPFTGDTFSNKYEVEQIIKQLVANYPDTAFISPIHTFGYLDGHITYDKSLDLCTSLLERCDGLILTGNWETSRGCGMERMFADSHGIKITEGWEWL